jgi:hypothetical protein
LPEVCAKKKLVFFNVLQQMEAAVVFDYVQAYP